MATLQEIEEYRKSQQGVVPSIIDTTLYRPPTVDISKYYTDVPEEHIEEDLGPAYRRVSNQVKSKIAWNNAWKPENALNSALGIGTAVLDITKNSIANAQIQDSSKWNNQISAINDYSFSANNFNDLNSQYNSIPLVDSIDYTTLRKPTGEKLLNTGKNILSGIQAGSKIGSLPGAIVGGIAGLVSGIGGWIAGDTAAAKEANRIRNETNLAITNANIRMNSQNENIKNNIYSNLMSRQSALGGPLHTHGSIFSNGLTSFDEGGTHEENQLGGIPIGVDQEGTPNLVEEGEVRYNDYIFSKRMKADRKLMTKFNIPYKGKDKPFADIAKLLSKESEEMPNDLIAKRGFADSMMKLQMAQEGARAKKMEKEMQSNKFADGGDMFKKLTEKGQWLRFAPIIGDAASLFTDAVGLTNKPNYDYANEVARSANNLTRVSPRIITNPMTYNPIDRNQYLTGFNAQAAATKSNIRNMYNGNRAMQTAAQLAADYNTAKNYGDFAIKGDAYNQQQRQIMQQADLTTQQANAELALKSMMTNMEQDKLRMAAIEKSAMLKAQEDAMSEQTRSNNINNFFSNTGLLGKEISDRLLLERFPHLLYSSFGDYLKDDENRKKKEEEKAKRESETSNNR